MKRQLLRRVLPMLIAAVCLLFVIRLFDWQAVLAALSRMRLGLFFSAAIPILAANLFLRGLRWLQVQGVALSAKGLWLSFLANSVSSGLGSFTPFQLGEAIKLRWIRIDSHDEWSRTVPGFIIERLMDLSGLIGIALAGLATHLGYAYLVVPAILMPLLAAALLSTVAKLFKRPPSSRWKPYLDAAHQSHRTYLAAIVTIPIWLLNAALWWIAALAVGVHLAFAQVFILIGGVTLAAIGSMAPGGLGVSELSGRGILLFLGFSQIEAESVAVAVRLITLLTIAIGAACSLAFAWRWPQRSTPK